MTVNNLFLYFALTVIIIIYIYGYIDYKINGEKKPIYKFNIIEHILLILLIISLSCAFINLNASCKVSYNKDVKYECSTK